MKMLKKCFSINSRLFLMVAIFAILSLGSGVYAQECCVNDVNEPQISITSPLSDGPYQTEQPSITLKGELDEDCAIQSMFWQVGVDPVVTGSVSGSTSNWLGWLWEAGDIPLQEGTQTITVVARDAAGNIGEKTFEVVYTPPGQTPQPPADSAKVLEQKKTKITFYFGSPDYDDLDRMSVVGYLKKDSEDVFEMPFDKDVTAKVEVPEPGDPSVMRQIFTQTIPAGTVSGTTKYRYVKSGGGIREMVFQSSTSTQLYFYLYIESSNFLPDLKAFMTVEAYQNYIKSIQSCTVSVQAGQDILWSGPAPLTPGTYSEHKQELTYNR